MLKKSSIERLVSKISVFVSDFSGSPWAFPVAVSIIVVWGLFGPVTGYSDTWQLVINTLTTLVTFLMGFLIQNTQNRDNEAVHLKLDEIIRALDKADNRLIDLEHESPEKVKVVKEEVIAVKEEIV